MLNQQQILRLVQFEEYSRLVDRVLVNGRCPCPLVRRQMCLSEAAAPAGLGLALQRLAELTYAPSPLSQRLVERLALLQRRDGSFGSGLDPSRDAMLAATGAALGGLLTWQRQRRAAGWEFDLVASQVIQRGLGAMNNMYGRGDQVEEQAVGWAIVAWQLGQFEEFRRVISLNDLLTTLGQSIDEPLLDDLFRYARAAAA